MRTILRNINRMRDLEGRLGLAFFCLAVAAVGMVLVFLD